jgi:protein involved in polysaccharide export with SLBB domain
MAMSVTIGGNFVVTGTFPAAPGERVDQFVTRLFNQAKSEKLALVKDYEKQQEILEKLDETPTREIKLRKNNGTEIVVDLAKFRLTGDFKYNPYLSHEDVLIFPSYDFQTDFVSVLGAVNIPVKFQYVTGDKFSDALMFAQGVSSSFENIKKFKIVRLSYDGKRRNFIFDIKENPELKRGDRIVVLAEAVNRKDFRLYIAGEVKQSGWIPITKGTTTLKDVIEKAGGLKENAD